MSFSTNMLMHNFITRALRELRNHFNDVDSLLAAAWHYPLQHEHCMMPNQVRVRPGWRPGWRAGGGRAGGRPNPHQPRHHHHPRPAEDAGVLHRLDR